MSSTRLEGVTDSRLSSPRFLLGVQIVVWVIVAIVFAINIGLASGAEAHPMCPSVLTALKNQPNGIPVNGVGLAEGLIGIGSLWYLTGALAWVYTRWPKYFLSFRVTTGRIFGPSARKAGLIVLTTGLLLLPILQLGCTLSD